MKAFVSGQIKKASYSVDIGRSYKACVFLSKQKLNFDAKLKKNRQNISRQLSHIEKLPNISQSQEIMFIKQQIKKLRTQSPQVYYRTPQKSPFVTSPNNKRKEQMSKIVISKLRRQKTKQRNRELKKSRVLLPKLDMEGQSCWSPSKGRYLISWDNQAQKQEEINPMRSVISLKRALKHRAHPSNSFTSEELPLKPRDRSVVSGWQRPSLTQDENELLFT